MAGNRSVQVRLRIGTMSLDRHCGQAYVPHLPLLCTILLCQGHLCGHLCQQPGAAMLTCGGTPRGVPSLFAQLSSFSNTSNILRYLYEKPPRIIIRNVVCRRCNAHMRCCCSVARRRSVPFYKNKIFWSFTRLFLYFLIGALYYHHALGWDGACAHAGDLTAIVTLSAILFKKYINLSRVLYACLRDLPCSLLCHI